MIKLNRKGRFARLICLALAVIMIALSVCSCANRVEKPILKCKGQAISLATYEFLLSRMKGTLARNKYDVNPVSEFWTEKHPGSDLTNEEYYNKSVLDSCKNYLAALVIFEEEGLVLSNAALASIEEEIAFYIDYDCNGSQEKLDTLLSKFGTDTDGLREIYTIEAKYQAVIQALYGLDGSQIADSVKEEYYRDNYYRFKQILVSNFYYKYMTDDSGNVMYFDPETSKPLYDEAGSYKYTDDGKRVVDEYGVAIRYDEEGNILYDDENGLPAPKSDEKGNAIKYEYTEAEMQERVAKMNGFVESCRGNASAFEAQIPEWQIFEGAEDYYPDGYYLSDLERSAYPENMLEILEKLKVMEVGDISVIESESGYHVIMKYELDKGKYSDSDYAEWFKSFNQSLIDKLYLDRCEKYFPEMKVIERHLKKARSIKSLGTNFDS